MTLILKMTTAQVVETSVSVNNNSPIQDFVNQHYHTQPAYEMTPGFKPSITHFKGLRCCLEKNFNISGGELDGSGKKSTTGRFRVSGWKGVDVGTSGCGFAVACSIARYPQVV